MNQTTYGGDGGKTRTPTASGATSPVLQPNTNQHTAQPSGTESGREQASQEVRHGVNSVRRQAEEVGKEFKQRAAEVAEAGRQKASEAAQQAKQSGAQYAREKKTRVAEELGILSGAIRKASQKLHEEKHDSIASYVDAAAEQLDCCRHSLESKDVGQLIEDMQDLARRRPELVYGGLFVAGLAAMRFLKASQPSGPSRRSYARNRQPPNTDMHQSPVGNRNEGHSHPRGDTRS